ncbi:MAG: hypothetical protein HDR09_20120 [Lachnospiraceae bacterium]|nr:hypothetical protein [Lachnospiraceae bacterium]MBD5505982.1 hypothetical protein [Lachnospiraceae bacterium]
MSVAAVIAVCIAAFMYIELAIGFGYYMFVLTSKKTQDTDETQKKQIKKYSIIAGVAFPVTFAIIIANKAAERK